MIVKIILDDFLYVLSKSNGIFSLTTRIRLQNNVFTRETKEKKHLFPVSKTGVFYKGFRQCHLPKALNTENTAIKWFYHFEGRFRKVTYGHFQKSVIMEMISDNRDATLQIKIELCERLFQLEKKLEHF